MVEGEPREVLEPSQGGRSGWGGGAYILGTYSISVNKPFIYGSTRAWGQVIDHSMCAGQGVRGD